MIANHYIQIPSLYGLKQASRNWYSKFSEVLIEFGFTHSTADLSLFCLHRESGSAFLLLYVDDIVISNRFKSPSYELG
jgi:hypothetical protein